MDFLYNHMDHYKLLDIVYYCLDCNGCVFVEYQISLQHCPLSRGFVFAHLIYYSFSVFYFSFCSRLCICELHRHSILETTEQLQTYSRTTIQSKDLQRHLHPTQIVQSEKKRRETNLKMILVLQGYYTNIREYYSMYYFTRACEYNKYPAMYTSRCYLCNTPFIVK